MVTAWRGCGGFHWLIIPHYVRLFGGFVPSSQGAVSRRQCLTSDQPGTVKHQELQFPHNLQRRKKKQLHEGPAVQECMCVWVSLASVIRPVISTIAQLISLFKFNEEGDSGGGRPAAFKGQKKHCCVSSWEVILRKSSGPGKKAPMGTDVTSNTGKERVRKGSGGT